MDSFLEQKPSITSNVIVIKPEEKRQCYEILSNNVTIIGSGGRHDHGSSKVKLKNIVDYKWEAKSYPGHLIAAHMDGKTIAYVIKVSNKLSGVEGMVRVTDAYSGQRALIKGMTGEVLDLQFAHIERKHILACIDESCLHVHKIDTLSENLICNLLLKINDPMQMHTPKYDKVSWCPYVPEEYSDEEEDISQLLVWSRGDTFQCFNVNTIINSFGIGSHAVSEITDGYLRLTDNSTTITWVALSPDGTTLGVGSEEGYINFYQVYFHEKEPRRLHQWNPHNGKAISSFFFLDNLTKTSADAYWKYALTGADQNTEFKIWDCGTWECLQTVYISAVEKQKMNFITEIDRTASYLVVSSVDTRTLYVFQISNGEKEVKQENDSSKNDNLDVKETTTKRISSVFIKSVSEFPLSSPTLSFSIIDAAVRKYKCELNDNYLLEEMDDYEEETNVLYCVVVRLFVVQPKSVQECHILYQPSIDDSCDVKSSISNESLDDLKTTVAVTNLSQVIKVEKTEENPTISEQQINNVFEKRVASSCSPPSKTPTKTSDSFPQLNLMTPESFVSSGKKSPECVSSEVLSTLLMLASVTGSTSSANKPENMNLLNLVNNKIIEDQEHQKLKEAMAVQKNFMSAEVVPGRKNSDLVTSGGSSPSREVQEIMSLQDYECNSYFKEEASGDASAKDQSQTSFSTVQENQKITNCNDKKKEKGTDAGNVHIWTKSYDMKSSPKSSVSATENEIAKLNIRISQLINIAEKQSSEISELRKEVIETKKINSDSFLNIKEHVVKIEKGLSKILEEHMVRYDKELHRTLENFMSARDIQNRELRGSIMHLLNQFLFNQFTEKLTNILIMEVQKHVVPVLVAKLDLIKQQVQAEVALKLTTTDKVLKENIAQVCKSKSIIDAFGNSVLMGVQNGLQATYIESMTNTLIPAYEKSSQEMFKQLHDTFSLGIKDVMEQFDNYLSQLQPVQDSTDEVLDKIDDLKKSLHSDHIKQRTSFNDALLEIRKDFKCSENNLSKNLSEIIQSEIRKGFESQAASLEGTVLSAVRSQTQTPAPSIQDVQGQIKQLLNQCQVNKAFHQALLANDLTLVEYTLEKADYKTVFNPCVLDQTVLLSLIQQISADLNNHNDTKQRYLSDGILNLDQNDPVTKEHAPKVMAELYRNCQRFLSFNSKSHLCSNIRMIMMAIQGMGYKMF